MEKNIFSHPDVMSSFQQNFVIEFKDLYIDEITRLKNIKEQKDKEAQELRIKKQKEKKRIDEEKRIADEKAKQQKQKLEKRETVKFNHTQFIPP